MMRFEKIPVDSIENDETFGIRYGAPSERLRRAISMAGIIHPIWVRLSGKSAEAFQLLLGRSRFIIAKSLHLSRVPCLIIEKEMSDRDILLCGVYDNLSQGEFNLVEKALVLKKSRDLFEKNRVIEEIMPVLSLAPCEETLNKTISVLDMEEGILSAIAKGEITSSNALTLLRFEKEEQGVVSNMFQNLRLGANLQKEFMENLFDCSRREGKSVNQILEKENLKTIITDKEKPAHIRSDMMRKELRRMRYPRLSEKEASFEQCVKDLKIAPHVRISAPPFFETRDFSLNVRFRAPEELVAELERLGAAFQSPRILEWFENHAHQENMKSD